MRADIMVSDRKIRELIISQAHSILAHLGPQKTLHYLKDNIWWPGLTANVKAFCESCHTCAVSKSKTTAPYGLLNPLAVPNRPWTLLELTLWTLPESHTLMRLVRRWQRNLAFHILLFPFLSALCIDIFMF